MMTMMMMMLMMMMMMMITGKHMSASQMSGAQCAQLVTMGRHSINCGGAWRLFGICDDYDDDDDVVDDDDDD